MAMTKQLSPSALADEKGRLYYYDNAKFILIFLVVLAHLLSPLTRVSPFCRVVWYTINAFHMPTFIFISGFFAKSYISKTREIKVQRTTTYIIIYLAAQLAVSLFEALVLKTKFTPSVMAARSSLWFLQCLILWHILLPYVERFKPVFVLVTAFVVALWAGYETQCGNFMAVSRVLVHFPFFLCGYYCSQTNIEKLFQWKVRIPLLILSAGIIVWFVFFSHLGFGKIITANYHYRSIDSIQGLTVGFYWVARVVFYLFAFILGAAFLSCIGRTKAWFTKLGSKSLAVYILHRFVYLAEIEYGWANYLKEPWGIAVLCVSALLLTLLFSVKPFTIPFDALQKIKLTRCMKNDGHGV